MRLPFALPLSVRLPSEPRRFVPPLFVLPLLLLFARLLFVPRTFDLERPLKSEPPPFVPLQSDVAPAEAV